MIVDRNVVDTALEMLRPGLASDGFELHVGTLTEGGVQVVLEATPEACLDCLVSDDMMVQMIDAAIRKQGSEPGNVELVRQGFDDAGAG